MVPTSLSSGPVNDTSVAIGESVNIIGIYSAVVVSGSLMAGMLVVDSLLPGSTVVSAPAFVSSVVGAEVEVPEGSFSHL